MPLINRCGGGGGYGTLPAQVSNFYATIGNASVALSWTKPGDDNFAGVLIVRKTGDYPAKPSDGVKIYQGTAQTYTDTGLTNGTKYYYRAFAYNSKREYQTVYCVATMTPLAVYELGTFPVGTKVKFGSLYGDTIVWMIVNKSGSDITLITDGVITLHAFDAAEPSNPNEDRQSYGNNRYRYSNIRQWLNSEAGAGSWYSAQHPYDHSPDSTDVVTEFPYSSEAGFLFTWTTKEKNYLKTTSRAVGNPDGDGTETFSDRIWLPSGTEMGLSTDFTEGSQLSEFSSDSSRQASITDAAAAHFSVPEKYHSQGYRLRTPIYIEGIHTCDVTTSGTVSSTSANYGWRGVRPLCNLDSSVLFLADVDADGCYTLA